MQTFGGRGASSGKGSGGGKIIQFAGGQESKNDSEKWDYRGERERVEMLEKAIDTTRGIKSLEKLSVALSKEDKHITKLMEDLEAGKENGDARSLMSLRRRIRQAITRTKAKRGM